MAMRIRRLYTPLPRAISVFLGEGYKREGRGVTDIGENPYRGLYPRRGLYARVYGNLRFWTAFAARSHDTSSSLFIDVRPCVRDQVLTTFPMSDHHEIAMVDAS